MQRPAAAATTTITHPLLFLLPLVIFGCLFQRTNGDQDLSKFLYLQEPPESIFPIQEYQGDDAEPPFLFSTDYPYPRIVEFYAHWCPHCKHFKPHYIEFAKKLRIATEQLPGDVLVETFAVSCVPYKELCHQMKIAGYPTVRIYQAHSINGTKVDIGKLHPSSILKTLGIQTDQYSEQQQQLKGNANLPGAVNGKDEKVQRQHFMVRSKKETFDDAHLSLDFILRNGIYTAPGFLQEPARAAFLSFVIKVLTRALPPSSSMYPVVSGISTSRGSIITSEQALVEVLDSLDPPPSKTWSPACRQHGTGYTCGLWTLFHIVTIGVVEWNMGVGDPDERLATLDVADTLRNFIEHFFQCDDCRAHFLSEYDNCDRDRCNRLVSDKVTSTFTQWKELPLWLYETHNGVNTRLRQERLDNHETEDTTNEWQVQWPAVADCPKCWLSPGRWDEEQVYSFLRLQYWPEDYKTSDIESRRHNGNDDELHPDVALAIRKESIVDLAALEAPKMSWSMLAIAMVFVLSGYVWHRKRKYDMKGYHKKTESDIC